LKKPDTADIPSFRKDISLLKSDLYFILAKTLHKDSKFEEAL
jgi:hypothetical protein